MNSGYTTWITVENGRIGRIRQTQDSTAPGPEWTQTPNDFAGSPGDDITWFDDKMRRIPDALLIEQGRRKDNRGRWYNTTNISETKQLYNLDEEPGDGWTKAEPLQNEPYQKFDIRKNKFVVDETKKAAAEKEIKIAETQAAIDDAERRIQRSTRAKLTGTATAEDEQVFIRLNAEINRLREEKRNL